MVAVLIVIGGLPATGKSTIAAELARRTATPYLRVDRIEQAVVAWSSLSHPVGPVGYAVAHAIALEQLQLGLDLIVECVNPSPVTRDAWLETASTGGAAVLEVEVVCTDLTEHRRRADDRPSDVAGLVKPTWEAIAERDYQPWTRPHLVLDTASTQLSQAAAQIAHEVAALRRQSTNPNP